jgi:hypothetical protein
MEATARGLPWQALLAPHAPCPHDARGFRRFVAWITGRACNAEAHTITQSLVGLQREQDWHALEAFAEYAAFDTRDRQRVTAQVLEDAPGRLGHGYHGWAGEEAKVHRSSKTVGGTCPFHEYTARCPNRATTVRAPNGVGGGALLHQPQQLAPFAPTAARLSFRRSQLPAAGNVGEEVAVFHTRCELLVFDGGFARPSVVRPLVCPERPALPRIDVVTRLRHDARLYVWPPPEPTGRPGRPPVWGRGKKGKPSCCRSCGRRRRC